MCGLILGGCMQLAFAVCGYVFVVCFLACSQKSNLRVIHREYSVTRWQDVLSPRNHVLLQSSALKELCWSMQKDTHLICVRDWMWTCTCCVYNWQCGLTLGDVCAKRKNKLWIFMCILCFKTVCSDMVLNCVF